MDASQRQPLDQHGKRTLLSANRLAAALSGSGEAAE
jgi:hypothetical protein